MLMGSSVMALHYSAVESKFGFCPVWSPWNWKDNCIEVLWDYCHSGGTKQMFSQLLCNGCMPLGIDDPNSQVVTLYLQTILCDDYISQFYGEKYVYNV